MQSDQASRTPVAALLASHTLAAIADSAAVLVTIGVLVHPATVGGASAGPTLALLAAVIAVPFMTVSPLAAGLGESRTRRAILSTGMVLHVLALAVLFAAFKLMNAPLAFAGVSLSRWVCRSASR
jgi:hypothetical protein